MFHAEYTVGMQIENLFPNPQSGELDDWLTLKHRVPPLVVATWIDIVSKGHYRHSFNNVAVVIAVTEEHVFAIYRTENQYCLIWRAQKVA